MPCRARALVRLRTVDRTADVSGSPRVKVCTRGCTPRTACIAPKIYRIQNTEYICRTKTLCTQKVTPAYRAYRVRIVAAQKEAHPHGGGRPHGKVRLALTGRGVLDPFPGAPTPVPHLHATAARRTA